VPVPAIALLKAAALGYKEYKRNISIAYKHGNRKPTGHISGKVGGVTSAKVSEDVCH
jgi:hypothetical protein